MVLQVIILLSVNWIEKRDGFAIYTWDQYCFSLMLSEVRELAVDRKESNKRLWSINNGLQDGYESEIVHKKLRHRKKSYAVKQ